MGRDDTTQPPDPATSEAEEAARQAAAAAGLPLDAWLRQTIKETVAAERTQAEAPTADEAEKGDGDEPAEDARRAAEDAAAAAGVPLGTWLGELLRAASREEQAVQPSGGANAAVADSATTTESPQGTPRATALPPEVERAASEVAATLGIPVATWLAQLIEEARRDARLPPEGAIAAAPLDLPLKRVSPDRLAPGRFQMRALISAEELASLSESIKARGVLQPILVRAVGGDAYEIIAGERRWRASRAAGLAEIPVLVLEVPDHEAMEIALVENLQRHDLSPLEEAEGYRRLTDELGETQDRVADAIGKSRSHVANTLRLLRLPGPVKAMLAEGRLSAGHGRAILMAADPEALARHVAAHGLTVRETEQLAQAEPGLETTAGRRRAEKDPDLEQIEEELSRLFGVNVRIALRGTGDRGTLSIRFKGLERLHEIIERLRT